MWSNLGFGLWDVAIHGGEDAEEFCTFYLDQLIVIIISIYQQGREGAGGGGPPGGLRYSGFGPVHVNDGVFVLKLCLSWPSRTNCAQYEV